MTNQRCPPAPWWNRCLPSCCWWTQSLPYRPDSSASQEPVSKTQALWVKLVAVTKPRSQEVCNRPNLCLCPLCLLLILVVFESHRYKCSHTDACWQTPLLIRLWWRRGRLRIRLRQQHGSLLLSQRPFAMLSAFVYLIREFNSYLSSAEIKYGPQEIMHTFIVPPRYIIPFCRHQAH